MRLRRPRPLGWDPFRYHVWSQSNGTHHNPSDPFSAGLRSRCNPQHQIHRGLEINSGTKTATHRQKQQGGEQGPQAIPISCESIGHGQGRPKSQIRKKPIQRPLLRRPSQQQWNRRPTERSDTTNIQHPQYPPLQQRLKRSLCSTPPLSWGRMQYTGSGALRFHYITAFNNQPAIPHK